MNYRLLKDLPDVKAGAIFQPFRFNPARYGVIVSENGNITLWADADFSGDIVKNNPDWFQPIPDEEILQGFADDEDGVKCHIWFETEAGMTITIPSILIRNPSEETKRKLGL